MFLDSAVTQLLSAELSSPLTLEAFAVHEASSNVATKCYDDAWFAENRAGHAMLIHPPEGQERRVLHAYKEMKKTRPGDTSALIIVPANTCVRSNQEWLPLLSRMKCLR